MVSDTPWEQAAQQAGQVLILVLMEYGLWPQRLIAVNTSLT